ncbi:hypothetical protein C9374_013930 [Naegleria lovaniensis]|uniref:Uncharacterized protein n=1 Tax=Naegleria lovaniensis TaxID=51637 RepID=A0AA88GYG6_NAELO|nr:uncharacterized protein C9374_013930 [Naegleria lovaniensis]KAG2389370.1 hypothetical protein C9374_013930 [Naegleria lovaniensis]
MKRTEYEGKYFHHEEERKIRKLQPTTSGISLYETQQDEIVVLKLFDLNYNSSIHDSDTEFLNYLCKKFTQGMRRKERKIKPFSMQFDLAYTFSCATSNISLESTCDVKISYTHGLILISSGDIHVFDLYTKKFITTFSIPDCELLYMNIEENFDGNNNDALFFDCYGHNCVFKYDLKRLVDQTINKESCDFIWKSEKLEEPRGMALWKDRLCFEENLLFVCNEKHTDGSILILRSSTGQTVRTITNLESPYGLTFTENGNELFVSMLSSIEIFRKDDKNQWTFERLLVENDDIYSQGLTYDKVSKTLISCNDEFNEIQIFQPTDGTIIKEFGENVFLPDSLCLNEETGELFVCQDDSVKVYK